MINKSFKSFGKVKDYLTTLAVFTFMTYLVSLIIYLLIGSIIYFISSLIFQKPLFYFDTGSDFLLSLEGIMLVAIVTASAYGIAGLDLKNKTLYRKRFESQVKDYEYKESKEEYKRKMIERINNKIAGLDSLEEE